MAAEDVRKRFHFIDWVMRLPHEMDKLFWTEVQQIQEERKMPFISTPERVGFREGIRKGIRVVLELRFGEAGLQLMPEIEGVVELEKLESILESSRTAASPEELRRLWTS